MQAVELKLKQASAVLGMPTKELQNLVQFGVMKPRRRRGSTSLTLCASTRPKSLVISNSLSGHLRIGWRNLSRLFPSS